MEKALTGLCDRPLADNGSAWRPNLGDSAVRRGVTDPVLSCSPCPDLSLELTW
jgi:hypothetical protein